MNTQTLIKILACPKCRGKLEIIADPEAFACPECGLAYPVKDDIPVMLIEEAVPLEEWRKKANK